MDHDELVNFIDGGITFDYHNLAWKALRAIVEFHEPWIMPGFERDAKCRACSGLDANDYPCLTIQAIEKVLNGQR